MTSRFDRRNVRLPVIAVLGAAIALASASAWCALTDLSNTPLTSTSNFSVLPNVMLIFDDSGSMNFDALPDNAENNQGGTERRYFHEDYHCKPKGTLTSSSSSSLDGQPANFCDRVDPPFGAVQSNGVYYDPEVTYRAAPTYDGGSYPDMDASAWSKASCDPYTGWKCADFYSVSNCGSVFSDYYNGNTLSVKRADCSGSTQSYANSAVAKWYGTGTTFDVAGSFPEIVYCDSAGASATDSTGTQCRRNGFSAATYDTGNPFRYNSAQWRSGYPEAPAIHQFVRASSGSTVTVTTADVHGLWNGSSAVTLPQAGSYPAFSTYQIIPRTATGSSGSGFDMCSNVGSATSCLTTVNITPTGSNVFTYSRGSGQRTAYSQFDLIVKLTRRKASASDATVYVTAPAHGFIAGDKVQIYALSPNNGFSSSSNRHVGCSQGATQTVTSVVDQNHFTYTVTGCSWSGSSDTTISGFVRKTNLFNIPKLRAGPPFYYTITAVEYCAEAALVNCIAATAPSTGYAYPAPVRYCRNPFDANRQDPPSGNDPFSQPVTNLARCRKSFQEESDPTSGNARSGYIYPRYGEFTRVNISAGNTFARASTRSDCGSGSTCSYTQEMTNFANWFSYYRNRILMMKTSVGTAFSPIDSRFNVGFITINAAVPPKSNDFLSVKQFNSAQKQAWYDILYNQTPGGGTPLQEALSRVGRYYAHMTSGINKGMDDDPVQYSCQQNFALLTTDGYWSDPDSVGWGVDLNGKTIGDVDNGGTDPHGKAIVRPQYDGNVNGKTPWDPDGGGSDNYSSGTLADVALYYYENDLRSTALGNTVGAVGEDVSTDNVPTRETDTANWQHMVTFGLGMANGLMAWRPDYDSPGVTGDYANVAKGATAGNCSWVSGTCNWPVPGPGKPANLDDLWHAAVNGRGKFFYAHDTASVQNGLNGALSSLQERKASGAAAATSTPNITPSDRSIFTTTYTTVQWSGDVIAQLINPNTGDVLPGTEWSAKDQLQSSVGPGSDSRTIYVFDDSAAGNLRSFKYAGMSATEQSWFSNRCTTASWSQCGTLSYGAGTPTNPEAGSPLWQANQGDSLVDFLRGQSQFEVTVYRDRQYVLGDIVNAVAEFIGKPRLAYGDNVSPSYSVWASTPSIANRKPVIYVGANDGMLHAFDVATGNELWAYVPRIVEPNLWKLAEMNYSTLHSFFVDGPLESSEVYDGSTWRTLLVGGLNSGGRGYYALDVTDPENPKALWEFCNDSSLCPVSDPDIGFSFGNPIITKRPSDGRWVVLVTSGYNNVSPGDGGGHLYVLDALTGAVIDKIDDKTGDASTPSGLGKINAWADNYTVDNTSKWVYGGDMLGNVWKFDLTAGSATVETLGRAVDASNRPQPITTKPEIALVDDIYKVVVVGTGRYLGTSDLTDAATQKPPGASAWQQSLYAFKDLGSDLGDLRGAAGMVQQTISDVSGTERTASAKSVDWSTQTGWFVDFDAASSPGERVNVDPQIALGTLLVVTNVPGGSACSIGGDSFVYQFDLRNGSYVATAPGQLVGTKQTGTLTVGLVVYQLPSGSLVGQLQESDTGKMKEQIRTAPGSSAHRRTSWRELTR